MPIDYSVINNTAFQQILATGFKSEFLTEKEPSPKGTFQLGTKAALDTKTFDSGLRATLEISFSATGLSAEEIEIYKFDASYQAVFYTEGVNKLDPKDEPDFINYLLTLAWLPMVDHITQSLEISGFKGVSLPLSPVLILDSD